MSRRDDEDDEPRDTSPVVSWSVATGIAPVPFLAVYATLFIIHGWLHPVVPPDITRTRGGELVAGLIALALFVLAIVATVWFSSGRRRWLFLLCQAATFATSVDFLVDTTKGPPEVPVLLAVTSLVALVLGVSLQAAEHVRAPSWAPSLPLTFRRSRTPDRDHTAPDSSQTPEDGVPTA